MDTLLAAAGLAELDSGVQVPAAEPVGPNRLAVAWLGNAIATDGVKTVYARAMVGSLQVCTGQAVYLTPADPDTPLYIGRITSLYQTRTPEPQMLVDIQWFYRPGELEIEPPADSQPKELLASDEYGTHTLDCVAGCCWVLAFDEYCRVADDQLPLGSLAASDIYWCRRKYSADTGSVIDLSKFQSTVKPAPSAEGYPGAPPGMGEVPPTAPAWLNGSLGTSNAFGGPLIGTKGSTISLQQVPGTSPNKATVAAENAQTLAQALRSFERTLPEQFKGTSWPQRRDAWVRQCDACRTIRDVAEALLTLDDNLQPLDAYRPATEVREAWRQKVRALHTYPTIGNAVKAFRAEVQQAVAATSPPNTPTTSAGPVVPSGTPAPAGKSEANGPTQVPPLFLPSPKAEGLTRLRTSTADPSASPIARHPKKAVYLGLNSKQQSGKAGPESPVLSTPQTLRRRKRSSADGISPKAVDGMGDSSDAQPGDYMSNEGQGSASDEFDNPGDGSNKRPRKSAYGRWSVERYEGAQRALVDIMRRMGAICPEGSVLRPKLRDEARKVIGDTGLLDHILKHKTDHCVSDEGDKLRRRHDKEGHMEYFLQSPAAAVEEERAMQDETKQLSAEIREIREMRALLRTVREEAGRAIHESRAVAVGPSAATNASLDPSNAGQPTNGISGQHLARARSVTRLHGLLSELDGRLVGLEGTTAMLQAKVEVAEATTVQELEGVRREGGRLHSQIASDVQQLLQQNQAMDGRLQRLEARVTYAVEETQGRMEALTASMLHAMDRREDASAQHAQVAGLTDRLMQLRQEMDAVQSVMGSLMQAQGSQQVPHTPRQGPGQLLEALARQGVNRHGIVNRYDHGSMQQQGLPPLQGTPLLAQQSGSRGLYATGPSGTPVAVTPQVPVSGAQGSRPGSATGLSRTRYPGPPGMADPRDGMRRTDSSQVHRDGGGVEGTGTPQQLILNQGLTRGTGNPFMQPYQHPMDLPQGNMHQQQYPAHMMHGVSQVPIVQGVLPGRALPENQSAGVQPGNVLPSQKEQPQGESREL